MTLLLKTQKRFFTTVTSARVRAEIIVWFDADRVEGSRDGPVLEDEDDLATPARRGQSVTSV